MGNEEHGTIDRGRPSEADTGTAQDHDALAVSLGAVARQLEQEDDPEAMLAEIVTAAVAMIPGVDEGSISVVTARRLVTSHASSGDLPLQVDALQEELQEGPCLSAAYEQETVRVPDLATEERWPRFAARASALGAASMLSLQLFVEGQNLGALNLYSRTPNAFTDESEHIGLLFAAHAAVALAGVRKTANLRRAVDARDLIGQAKGILMERHKLTADRAFMILVRVSQNTNRKVNEIAEELVHSGTLNGVATRQLQN